jgi:hypothetical protein
VISNVLMSYGFAPKVPEIADFRSKNETLGAEMIVLYTITKKLRLEGRIKGISKLS